MTRAPGPGGFTDLVGLQPALMDEGRAVFTVALGPQHLNPNGVDSVTWGPRHGPQSPQGGSARPGEAVARLEAVVRLDHPTRSCVAPAVTGTLSCDARLLDRSRRIAVLEARIADGDGRLIAVATGSFYVTNSSR